MTVREAFIREREHLVRLPAERPSVAERVEVRVPKTPYVRFDLNDYSVPHALVRRMLTVLADAATVRVLDGGEEVARHARSWSRGEQIEDERHVAALVAIKREAREHCGQSHLGAAVPATRAHHDEAGPDTQHALDLDEPPF